MTIKITATTVEEFQRIEQQIKLIGNNDLIKKFSRADTSFAGYLTFHSDDFTTNDKVLFSQTISINRVELSASERQKAYSQAGEIETIYSARIWVNVTPENRTNENVDKPFEAIFNVWSLKPAFEISAR